MKVLGLSGFAGAGKDSVAAILCKQGWARLAFADALKSVAYATDPFIGVNFKHQVFDAPTHYVRLSKFVDDVGWDRAKTQPDVRRFLQRLGTEGCRDHLGLTIWADVVAQRIVRLDAEQRGFASVAIAGVVVTDVRFKTEHEALLGLVAPHLNSISFRTAEVVREGHTPPNTHRSELEWANLAFDTTILNPGPDAPNSWDRLAEAVDFAITTELWPEPV